jgi:hypothetical protein
LNQRKYKRLVLELSANSALAPTICNIWECDRQKRDWTEIASIDLVVDRAEAVGGCHEGKRDQRNHPRAKGEVQM